jgi:hypothetical protein
MTQANVHFVRRHGRVEALHGTRMAGGASIRRRAVTLRPLEDTDLSTLGNRFGLVFLSLPVGVRADAAHPRARREWTPSRREAVVAGV